MAAEPDYVLIVPKGAAASVIARGSAVVGVARDGGWDVRYEGAIHFPMPWEERVVHAAGRLHERYPTSASAFLHEDDAVVVGAVGRDPATGDWIVVSLDDAESLREWRGGEETGVGASDEQRRRAAGRMLSRGGTRAMAAFAAARARGADPVAAVLSAG